MEYNSASMVGTMDHSSGIRTLFSSQGLVYIDSGPVKMVEFQATGPKLQRFFTPLSIIDHAPYIVLHDYPDIYFGSIMGEGKSMGSHARPHIGYALRVVGLRMLGRGSGSGNLGKDAHLRRSIG